jgi:hypothetical protein
MRRLARVLGGNSIFLVLVCAMAGSASSTPATNIRAKMVTTPPKVQSTLHTYFVRVRVTNRGATFKPLCVDFRDDNNAWRIYAPFYRGYRSDAFCVGTLLRGQSKLLMFQVIASRSGAHRMSLTVGKAQVYSSINSIVIDDPALMWEGHFVIVLAGTRSRAETSVSE